MFDSSHSFDFSIYLVLVVKESLVCRWYFFIQVMNVSHVFSVGDGLSISMINVRSLIY